MIYPNRTVPDRVEEPTAADLAAIEAEWPLIAAEIAVVDAEIAIISTPHEPTELDWRRLRRARHRALAEAAAFASRTTPPRRPAPAHRAAA